MGNLRVFFHPGSTGSYTPEINLRKINGLPHHAGREFENAYDYKNYLTNNHGNLVHYESVCRFLDIDLAKSCRGGIAQIFNQFDRDFGRFNKFMTKNFDYVVISSINFITNTKEDNAAYSRTAEILDGLEIPFAIFGVGIQEPPSAEELEQLPHLRTYLQILNDKATLFACRGEVTASWCREHGFDKAVAMGCPSMYVFPDAIDRCLHKIDQLSDDASSWRFASAGKIHRKYRRAALFKCFEKGDEIDYFFQDELRVLVGDDAGARTDIFQPATGQLDCQEIEALAKAHLDPRLTLPFNRMYFCSTPDSWRQQASNADVYIGDRLHGGIVCLQAGLPCVFLTDDDRVREVAEHFQMPVFNIKDVGSNPELVRQYRSKDVLRDTYKAVKAQYSVRIDELKTLLADVRLPYREL